VIFPFPCQNHFAQLIVTRFGIAIFCHSGKGMEPSLSNINTRSLIIILVNYFKLLG